MPAWGVKRHGNDLHTPVPVSPLDLYSEHFGRYHGESFLCDYLDVWTLWLCPFIWSPAELKSAWTDTGKLAEHVGSKYGWIGTDCGKTGRLKLGPMPTRTTRTRITNTAHGSFSQLLEYQSLTRTIECKSNPAKLNAKYTRHGGYNPMDERILWCHLATSILSSLHADGRSASGLLSRGDINQNLWHTTFQCFLIWVDIL